MLDDLKLRAIEKCALDVIESDGLDALPIDPIAIAQRREILVHAKSDSERGVSGMLVKHGDSFAIAYATHVPSKGFQRFSIAHELGHYFLPDHPEKVFSGSDSHSSRGGFVAGDPIELEADHFAASLLMPRKLFTRAMDKKRDGMDAVVGLADVCETSRIATAIRYAQLSVAPVAVIVSTSQAIDYCFLSPSLRAYKGLQWSRKGRALPKASVTLALRMRPGAVDNCESDTGDGDTSVWFDSDNEIALTEEVVGLGEYGRTLTVLTVAEEDDEDGGDEDPSSRSPRW